MNPLSKEELLVQDSPELIRKRREARRNMTTAERVDLLSQTIDRVNHKHTEEFRQQCIKHWHEEQAKKERKNKDAEKPVETSESQS